MAAGNLDLSLEQNATYVLNIKWNDSSGARVDLSSGYTAELEIRQTLYNYEELLTLNNTTAIGTHNTNKEIVLSSGAGDTPNIVITFPATKTALIECEAAAWSLNITVTATDQVIRLLEGDVTIALNATR